ncbi:Chromosome (plasmid) partitioning protein ParA [Candidatus Syntrophocurvum alkaliphilum]|uniref:Sporulation initiation inhibitor protein Soj n=1 Tax=Candidatus Syntrophocurvum alkaliphilum TaxID=2293317 RepID=A0A6I6DF90_9FIRM|nr:AAA family ATPase [Candidatus Syntrophocurvum alkaliphilum]QGT99767.1 Chromosome (plasmid) partitioning protein ParA [Candidatus Syntrophocurvum alkaliphilum]
MRKIAISNQKGGTGKTTSTINIAYGLQKKGQKVLVIDLDPQANLTASLGISDNTAQKNIFHIMKNECHVNDAILDIRNVSIIPANINLAACETEFSNIAGREFILKESLHEISDFDFILLDCSPSLGLLTLNAFVMAEEIIIPVQAEFLALQGMSKLLETIEIVKNRINPSLKISGIISTRYDNRKILNREVVEKLETHFADKLFSTFIRENISLAEAPSFGQDIFTYRPDSAGAKDYLSLCEEILKRS